MDCLRSYATLINPCPNNSSRPGPARCGPGLIAARNRIRYLRKKVPDKTVIYNVPEMQSKLFPGEDAFRQVRGDRIVPVYLL